MKKQLVALLLVAAIVLGFAACGTKQSALDMTVNLKQVRKQDLGAGMPKIIFANEEKVGFWGTFGLFIINTDGSMYRTLDVGKLGLNSMGGEEISRYLISEDYNKIYFFNEGEDEENVDPDFYYYNIEEDIMRVIPVGTGVEVLPPTPAFSMDIVGGEQPGYTSNLMPLDEDTIVYLQATDWEVKTLQLCKFTISTEETERIPLFK